MTSYACWFWGHLSINCLITLHDNAPSLSREYSRNMLMNDHHEKRSGRGHHEKRSGSGQHEKRTGSGQHEKKKPGSGPWPSTFDPWPLTLTRKRTNLTTMWSSLCATETIHVMQLWWHVIRQTIVHIYHVITNITIVPYTVHCHCPGT